MALANLIPVEAYLSTSYRPDCEYLDGILVERNVGQTEHSDVQSELLLFLRSRRKSWNIWAGVEKRIRVASGRFRIPDVCVVLGSSKPKEAVLCTPPFLCIEVLSPDDRMSEMLQRVEDYLRFGVQNVWVVDPQTRTGYVYTPQGEYGAKHDVLKTSDPELLVPLAEIFSTLDQ